MDQTNQSEEAKMPRTTRLIVNDETAVYHIMSRTALDGFPLGDAETPVKSAALLFYEKLNGAGPS